MAAPNKKIVQGVETLELAVIDADGVTGAWVRAENVAPGTVSYTSNTDNETSIIPEDKDSPIIVLYTPGDPDQFNFGLLELSEYNFGILFNVEQDLTTSTTTVLASRKRATLAIRLTTRPVNGAKKIITYPNTQVEVTLANNFTRDALVAMSAVANILSFLTEGGVEAIYTIQTVKADGSVINGTPPTVSAGSNTTSSAATKSITGTASASGGKTIASTTWSFVSGPNTPGFSAPNALTTNVTGMITGTYVIQLTAVDSDGVSSSSTVQIVATVS